MSEQKRRDRPMSTRDRKAARAFRSGGPRPRSQKMTPAAAKQRRMKKGDDAAMLRKLTEKLAKQLLRRDGAAAAAERKVSALEEQLADLHAWQGAARGFVQRTADKRKSVNGQFAARDRALVIREQRVAAREAEVEARDALLATCQALERELRAEKRKRANMNAATTETERRSERREQELRFSKREVHALERTFVGHLQHMLEIQNDVLAKISDDADVGATQKAVEVSREMLKTRLSVACASDGAAKGTGLSGIANELVESLKDTYGKSSDKAEELRTERAQLTQEVADLSAALETVTAEKVHLTQKLRSEQLNLRQMCKRVDRLQRSEVIELRAMLEHSQKKYMELHSMLQEYLSFSQEEMERCLGFIPRTVAQVADVARGAPENPLADFVGKMYE